MIIKCVCICIINQIIVPYQPLTTKHYLGRHKKINSDCFRTIIDK